MPGVGDHVPDFSLKDHTGSEVSLSTRKESGKRTCCSVLEDLQGVAPENSDLVLPCSTRRLIPPAELQRDKASTCCWKNLLRKMPPSSEVQLAGQ
eukprot:s11_g23.t1